MNRLIRCIMCFCFLFVCHQLAGHAQQQELKPLKVGDKVPAIFFKKMIGYEKGEENLSALYNGKLLILDFWTAWCGTCKKAFPHLEELQQKYGDKIAIITVGFNTLREGEMEAALTIEPIKLPTAIQTKHDSVLRKLFPFPVVPTEVWIDSRGIYRGMTGHKGVAEDIIDSVLNNEYFIIPPRINPVPSDKRLLLGNNVFGSAISGYHAGLYGGGIQQIDSAFIRVFFVNRKIFELYVCAYEMGDEKLFNFTEAYKLLFNNRYIISLFDRRSFYKEASDDDLLGLKYEEFKKNNYFCYEAILPISYSKKQIKEFMIQDLNRYFQIRNIAEK